MLGVCPSCKEVSDKKGYCRPCASAMTRVWRLNNPEKVRVSNKKQDLKKRYGISLKQYNQLFTEQNGLCATCDIHQTQLRRALCVDHDHTTGAIRGLLCDDCNIALGHVRDEANTLNRMIEYLSKTNTGSAESSDNKDNIIFIKKEFISK